MQHDGTATTTHPGKGDGDPRLPLREKVGYGLGDFGFNLYWANISAFLLIFYTDVMGLAAAAVGTMLLVTKISDAVTDPLMGALADRTPAQGARLLGADDLSGRQRRRRPFHPAHRGHRPHPLPPRI